MEWLTDARVEQACGEAEERAREIIGDSDDSVLHYTIYGADWIKSTGIPIPLCPPLILTSAKAKFSPDAYLQMVLQLAWYRTRGTFTATYETALTRMFQRGRTETIRTLSTESRAWVLGMVDRSISVRLRTPSPTIQRSTLT
jgi:carnitine O-acetyltransferase